MKRLFVHEIVTAAALAALALPACGGDEPAGTTDAQGTTTGDADSTGAPTGGTAADETTGDAPEPTTAAPDATTGEPPPAGGEPDYGKAFPQDRVPRLDITITPADWEAMLADMTDMLGAFGEGMGGMGGMGGMPPEELLTACEGLAEGDPCMATFMGQPLTGTCTSFMGPDLLCLPDDFPGPDGGGGVDLVPRTPIYVECDVATEDSAWQHVGIRFKGNSSLAMPWMQGVYKLPLRLNFDKYEDQYPEIEDQRFYGFESLSLSNGSMDASLLRDKVGTDVFARAGVPAPAAAFYRVFIDHGDGPIYFGLYTGIELPSDESFLDTKFGGHEGNLYKPDGAGARWDVWDPETLDKENHEDEADFSDAQALFDALHADQADPAAWRAGLEATLDVAGFLHWLALNTVAQDWDTYGRMPHNYYLYADPGLGGRFRWIPWDHTFAFSGAQAPSLALDEIGDGWPLIRLLLDDPIYAEVYRDLVAQAAATEYEPLTATQWFQDAHDLIAPYVVGPEGELPGYTFLESDAAFDDALADLLAHVKARQQDVAEFLAP